MARHTPQSVRRSPVDILRKPIRGSPFHSSAHSASTAHQHSAHSSRHYVQQQQQQDKGNVAGGSQRAIFGE